MVLCSLIWGGFWWLYQTVVSAGLISTILSEILKDRLVVNFPNAELVSDDPTITAIVSQTVAFLETPKLGFSLPLDIKGTAFQQRVWNALRDIRPGTTVSYADIGLESNHGHRRLLNPRHHPAPD